MKKTSSPLPSANLHELSGAQRARYREAERGIVRLRNEIASASRHFDVSTEDDKALQARKAINLLAAFDDALLEFASKMMHCSAWEFRRLQDHLTEQAEALANQAKQLRSSDPKGSVKLMRVAVRWFDVSQPIFGAWFGARTQRRVFLREADAPVSGPIPQVA